MVISGHVENNVIVLDEAIELPEGVKVEIILPDAVEEMTALSSGLCGIWEDDRSADEIVAEILAARTIGRHTPVI